VLIFAYGVRWNLKLFFSLTWISYCSSITWSKDLFSLHLCQNHCFISVWVRVPILREEVKVGIKFHKSQGKLAQTFMKYVLLLDEVPGTGDRKN
jgi:hypothetical protein